MPNRRELLLAAPAILTLARSLPAWAEVAPGVDPFTLGVASGDPGSDGFVIWTRLAPDPLALDGLGGLRDPALVRWEVGEDEAMTRIAARGEQATDPRSAHAVHVEISGLQPNRPYWYRFTALGAQSAIGRARTTPLPDQGLDRLRLTVASCAHYEVGYYSAYRHMAAEAADLTLFLGDYIYEYSYGPSRVGGVVRPHGGMRDAVSLADYRHRYARYKTDPDLQALHAAAPCLVTWDDHEVENDYGGALSQIVTVTPETFLRRRAAAYQAFCEHMPIRKARMEGLFVPIHRRVRFGRLAEFYVLDTRQYRSPVACLPETSRRSRVTDPACAERLDPRRSMLGFEQESWLYNGFRQAGANWNVISQSLLAASLLQAGPDGKLGHWADGWDGYPATRDRMLEAIQATQLSNPVVLSGDIHSFWANELKADPRSPESASVATEFVTSSVTSDGPPLQPFANVLADNPHVRHFSRTEHGYVSVDLQPDQMQVRFQAVSDRVDPAATVATLREFSVSSGRPQIV
jgi:alkaline phosphatase D